MDPTGTERAERQRRARESAARTCAEGRRILLLDPDLWNHHWLWDQALLNIGVRPVEAESLEQASTLASPESVDLILASLRWPDVDALEMARRIRTWAGETTPIIGLMPAAIGGFHERVVEIIDDAVYAPIDPNTIYDVLVRWLPRSEQVTLHDCLGARHSPLAKIAIPITAKTTVHLDSRELSTLAGIRQDDHRLADIKGIGRHFVDLALWLDDELVLSGVSRDVNGTADLLHAFFVEAVGADALAQRVDPDADLAMPAPRASADAAWQAVRNDARDLAPFIAACEHEPRLMRLHPSRDAWLIRFDVVLGYARRAIVRVEAWPNDGRHGVGAPPDLRQFRVTVEPLAPRAAYAVRQPAEIVAQTGAIEAARALAASLGAHARPAAMACIDGTPAPLRTDLL